MQDITASIRTTNWLFKYADALIKKIKITVTVRLQNININVKWHFYFIVLLIFKQYLYSSGNRFFLFKLFPQ